MPWSGLGRLMDVFFGRLASSRQKNLYRYAKAAAMRRREDLDAKSPHH